MDIVDVVEGKDKALYDIYLVKQITRVTGAPARIVRKITTLLKN